MPKCWRRLKRTRRYKSNERTQPTVNTSTSPASNPGTVTIPNIPTTPSGTPRTCQQCATSYRAPRATSRYCAAPCRLKAHRGVTPSAPKETDLLRRWLVHRSYAGQINAANKRNPRPAVYGLTVPTDMAREEWNDWNPEAALSETAFITRLKAIEITPYR